MRDITISLDPDSIDQAIKTVEAVQREIKQKCEIYIKRLCEAGFEVSKAVMSGHEFTGETSNSLRVVSLGDSGTGHMFSLEASSAAILYFEFGAGIRYSGQKHPQADELGMGAGTHSPGKHWDNPGGWWYPTDDSRLIKKVDKNGQGWGHSYGNQPYMPMYKATQEIINIAQQIAEEVFA